MTAHLIVAGVSVRGLTEAAVRDGYTVTALDAFGDADTRRAAARWDSVASNTPSADGLPALDPERLTQALAAAAQWATQAGLDTVGWVAGSGFEGMAQALGAGGTAVPLMGNGEATVRAVRDPHRFFDVLQGWGIAHPEVRFKPPVDEVGAWIWKSPNSCGGLHIRPATASASVPSGGYWQRVMPGRSVSVSFLARGRRAEVLGINEQIVSSVDAQHPYRFNGALGPLALPGRTATAVQGIADRLTLAWSLRGWCSLDGLLDADGAWSVLELNPRPSASLALYGGQGGLMRLHLAACLGGRAADEGAWLARLREPTVRGFETVYAPRPWQLRPEAIAWLQSQPEMHDLPAQPQAVAAGTPVCTVGASAVPGTSPDEIRARLGAAREAVIDTLESFQ